MMTVWVHRLSEQFYAWICQDTQEVISPKCMDPLALFYANILFHTMFYDLECRLDPRDIHPDQWKTFIRLARERFMTTSTRRARQMECALFYDYDSYRDLLKSVIHIDHF